MLRGDLTEGHVEQILGEDHLASKDLSDLTQQSLTHAGCFHHFRQVHEDQRLHPGIRCRVCRIEMTWSEAVSNVPAHDPVIYGTEGTLIAGRQVTLYTRTDKAGAVVDLDELPTNGLNATDHFLHSVRTGAEPQFQTSAQLSRAAQEIMEGGLRSAISGVEVSLPIEDHLFRD